jgi:YbbR domain-containing protein
MKALLLNNWKAKVASLLVAIAIWYLVKDHLAQPSMPFFPNTSTEIADYPVIASYRST